MSVPSYQEFQWQCMSSYGRKTGKDTPLCISNVYCRLIRFPGAKISFPSNENARTHEHTSRCAGPICPQPSSLYSPFGRGHVSTFKSSNAWYENLSARRCYSSLIALTSVLGFAPRRNTSYKTPNGFGFLSMFNGNKIAKYLFVGVVLTA